MQRSPVFKAALGYNERIHSDDATRCEAANTDANTVLRQYDTGKINFKAQNLKSICFIKVNTSGTQYNICR
jgi:hypothetical protein